MITIGDRRREHMTTIGGRRTGCMRVSDDRRIEFDKMPSHEEQRVDKLGQIFRKLINRRFLSL